MKSGGEGRCFNAVALLAALLSALCLTSCSGGGLDAVLVYLGIDAADYGGEEVTGTLAGDDEITLKLLSQTRILSIDSPVLTPFSDFKTALRAYRDSVLNAMLNESYSKYTGNIELLDRAAAEYPSLMITTLIPAEDFEYRMYLNFGGSRKASHSDGVRFSYLPKIEAYTSVAQPRLNEVTIEYIACVETEHTYRLTFRNILDAVSSPDYVAVFVKRDDGTCYMDSLTESNLYAAQ